MPTVYVIAGPNGVGKTTFADRHLRQTIRELNFVNVDLIARGLSPYDPDSAAMEAGRIALKRIRQLISGGNSFTWETTMSGRTAVGWLRAAKNAGYEIKCTFLWVRDIDAVLRRIQHRVSEGGHGIETGVLKRRFHKSIRNFFMVYRPLFDSWRLFENDGPSPRLLAFGKMGRTVFRDRAALEKIAAVAGVDL